MQISQMCRLILIREMLPNFYMHNEAFTIQQLQGRHFHTDETSHSTRYKCIQNFSHNTANDHNEIDQSLTPEYFYNRSVIAL